MRRTKREAVFVTSATCVATTEVTTEITAEIIAGITAGTTDEVTAGITAGTTVEVTAGTTKAIQPNTRNSNKSGCWMAKGYLQPANLSPLFRHNQKQG